MPLTDARGHTVPAATDMASRQSLLDLSLSIGDIRTCSTLSQANSLVSSLAAAGVRASAGKPVYVRISGVLQAWNGARWEVVQAEATRSTTPLTVEKGWVFDPSSGSVLSVGALHLAPLTIRWPKNSFNTEVGIGFPLAHLPAGVPAPAVDWTSLGTLHAGAYAMPLVYRSATRAISVQPTSAFSWGTGWCYGTATWIA